MSPFVEIFIRTTSSFMTLIVLTRLMGRRAITQVTFHDFVASLAIGSVAGALSIGRYRSVPHLLFALVVWSLLTLATEYLTLNSRRLRTMVDGGPTVIIENGKILEERMRKLRYTHDDLLSMLRQQGVFKVREVENGVLELGGQLSIQKKSQQRPVTPADLSIPTEYEGIAVTLISDGQIRDRNLAIARLDRDWLIKELQDRGLTVEEIFFAQLDTSGQLYLDLRHDRV